MKDKIIELFDKKLKELEDKITKASTPPLTGSIYSLEGWLAESKLLIGLKNEIEQLDKVK